MAFNVNEIRSQLTLGGARGSLFQVAFSNPANSVADIKAPFLIRNALEEWSNRINSLQGNLRSFGSAAPLLYKSTAEVTQFSKTGVPIRTYKFNGIYPSSISAIDLNWGDTDSIEEFQVTFQYDWWQVSGGITGQAGGA